MDALALAGYAAWTFGFFLLVVFTQDLQVFPAVIFSLLKRKGRRTSKVPSEVESIFVETDDNKRIEVWRVPPAVDAAPSPYVGVIFHGNAGSLENFFALQLWFHYLGMTSYCFDYRGIGRSTGWPRERGLELDSDAVYRYVAEREKVGPEQIIIFGYSVGSAMAARIASLHQPKLLILMSALTDAKRILRETPVMSVFCPFLWWRLPTIDYVRALKTTHLIIAHGERDRTIPPRHGRDLLAAYAGTGRTDALFHGASDHNNLFFTVREELAAKMLRILSAPGTA